MAYRNVHHEKSQVRHTRKAAWEDVPVRGFQDQLGDVALPISASWQDRYYFDEPTKQKNADDWIDAVLKRYGDGQIAITQRDEITRISHEICTTAHEERLKKRLWAAGGVGQLQLLTPTFAGVTKPAAFAVQRFLTETAIVEQEAKQRDQCRWTRVVGKAKGGYGLAHR